jgi:hypothetical protein
MEASSPLPEAGLGIVELSYKDEGREDLQQGRRLPPPNGGLRGQSSGTRLRGVRIHNRDGGILPPTGGWPRGSGVQV